MTTEDTPTFPAHWTADVLLRDGRTAHIRPVEPGDKELLVEFYARVSDESKYYRFFSPMPVLSDKDVHRFTEVDYVDRVAFVLTLRGRMIAIGRYDVVKPGRAEVAFLVEDAYQGRGIGQVLLEHLAQAARERGISKFVAEVLPDNSRMIQTFRDAGYKVASGYEDGVISLEFPIEVTETAIGVLAAREHEAEAASINRFFNPRSVAIIGASRRQETVGQLIVRNLVNGDFTGRVYVVNPNTSAVSGMPAYKSVAEIPDEVDVAIVAVPAEAVQEVVLDCAAKGVHGLVVISSGFAETGDEGRRRQRRLVGLSRSYGLRLIGPNALGIINTDPQVSINASLAPTMPPRGRAGFFCQSGALGSAILEKVNNRGLGLTTFVSAGNRADVSGNDLLQYWEEDESTEVVMMYLESIGNPRKFSRIARRVSQRKPIVAVRSGRTTQGVPMGQMVRRIAAPPQAVDAMFKQAGIIQVDTLEDMFDVAQLLAHQPLPRGRRVAIVGNSDALGLLAADAAAGVGLAVNKQVALPAEPSPDEFEDALDAAIDDPDVDAVVAVYIPPLNVSGDEIANVLAAVGEQSDKPLVTSFLGAEGVPELLRVPDVAGSTAGRGSVPSYSSVESAVRALARVVEYAVWLRTPDSPALPDVEEQVDVIAARQMVREMLADLPGGGEVGRDQVTRLLATYGVELWPSRPVASVEEAVAAASDFGWDVVLKATADHLRERPDQAHVVSHIGDAEEMHDAWHELVAAVGEPTAGKGFLVQRTAPPGVPITIRTTEDPLFGPVISFGMAGPLSELVGDRSYRIPPLTHRDAAAMVREVKAAPLLFGYRGADVVDVDEVERLIRRVAQLQNDLPQVSMLELGLALVGTEGAAVLTASARLDPVDDARSDWFVRRLNAPAMDTLPS
ncbi:bifunctional acetate--CoA ligase family protein/GNAT family N-acetyltransferase [Nocardioides nematodiphilus]|uniref:bifunctional acetate--CoA ligase family protein/GNAT family N-acetyltransferase n=1 Tax=Nocardioides nematodiphilus TaxID=2849669 RepID=UPI001CD918BA|nr:bifunctional GNAT family N-acetyltransferase/acetate--CoA ligase family protein [Nocardioides nematodiphilus]MCA1982604.1 GNAT family N-acetyltransferase [Nocardioides nematodiphilus]